MKRIFAALAIGLALGFALLGVGLEPTVGRTTPSTPMPPRSSPISQINTPQHGGPAQRPAHQYAGLNVRLNQNVIDAAQTLRCTMDQQMFEALTSAIAAWNQAQLSFTFRADDNQPPRILHQTLFDRRTAKHDATTTLCYSIYDVAGESAAMGSYAFLSDSGDAAGVVDTYEGLRNGTASRLLIHKADAQGVSQATFYDAVAAGDFFEWREADDCWVRYRVTKVLPDPPSAAPRKLLAVEWTTYAFSGCSGAIAADAAVAFDWGPLPDLGGPSLIAPIRHGPFQIVPEGWEGPVEEDPFRPWPGNSYANPVFTADLAEARQLPYWRDPALPPGWTLLSASSGDPSHDPPYGYCASWANDRGYRGVGICGGFHPSPDQPVESSWHGGRGGVVETRMIAGRPAFVVYSPAGPNHNRYYSIQVWIYDPVTVAAYDVNGYDWTLNGSNIDAVIAIARSLFDE